MSQKNFQSTLKRRIQLLKISAVVISLFFSLYIGYQYALSPVLYPEVKAKKNTITYNAIKDYVLEGDIVDIDGATILGNAEKGQGAVADYPKNYSYAYLLGYYTVDSSKENLYGLRGGLRDYSLFTLDNNNKGATVTLTTDNSLQNFAFESILGNQEGSVTVIDNQTGAIKCLTSRGPAEYDVNNLDAFIKSDIPTAQYRRGTYENDPPGSTFKVITAAAALQKQQEEDLPNSYFLYEDTGSYVPAGSEFNITNYDGAVYGQIDLEQALNHSVNTYFADLGVRLGEVKMKKTAEAFMIGKDIEIPFLTTIHSKMDFSDKIPYTVAQTAFGQGNTEMTPVHIAMVAQAIANDGKMMAPYVVDNIKSGNKPLYKHINKKLSDSVSKEVDRELKRIMHSTAVGYGFDEATYGMVFAKTGTAECANDRIHTYIMGFTKDASFCISMNDSERSYDLWTKGRQLVSFINDLYSRNATN